MTGGGPLFASTTASLYMCRQAFEFGLLSKGASAGIVLIVINLSVASYLSQIFEEIKPRITMHRRRQPLEIPMFGSLQNEL